jgi:hypothetical protein
VVTVRASLAYHELLSNLLVVFLSFWRRLCCLNVSLVSYTDFLVPLHSSHSQPRCVQLRKDSTLLRDSRWNTVGMTCIMSLMFILGRWPQHFWLAHFAFMLVLIPFRYVAPLCWTLILYSYQRSCTVQSRSIPSSKFQVINSCPSHSAIGPQSERNQNVTTHSGLMATAQVQATAACVY